MQVEVVLIESDDVENAIAEEINKSAIGKLVIGAASRGLFTRYSLFAKLLIEQIK